MASSSSSSLSPSSDNNTVSSEEIKLFHTIDRAIYSRLVLNLRREPIESMHIMALFLWFEHYCKTGRNLVYSIQTWPDALINVLADEGVMCLSCINNDGFDPFPLGHVEDRIIPWIRKLTNNEASFNFFRAHRVDMVQGIVQLVRDVCFRAFDDIVGLINNPMAVAAVNEPIYDVGSLLRPILHVSLDPRSGREASLRAQKKAMKNEMEDLSNRINNTCIHDVEEKIDNDKDNDNNKPNESDDRTIFLTFSKGYSVTEDEARDYFTRRFGEIFEGVEMQEVPEGEQPLWAKLVLVSGSTLAMVLGGKVKAKFSINGKHVWARKYVRKNNKSEHAQ